MAKPVCWSSRKCSTRQKASLRHPEQFSRDLAAAVNTLLQDPALRAAMARRARIRVEEQFSWTSIARQTLAFYEDVIARVPRDTKARDVTWVEWRAIPCRTNTLR